MKVTTVLYILLIILILYYLLLYFLPALILTFYGIFLIGVAEGQERHFLLRAFEHVAKSAVAIWLLVILVNKIRRIRTNK